MTQSPSAVGVSGPDVDFTILADCRWYGAAGLGRVVENLLTAWHAAPPEGRWLIWGPPALRRFLWPGATLVEAGRPAALLFRDYPALWRLPRYDAAFFPHQLHPIPSVPYVTIMHDTTPIRWGGSLTQRLVKRAFFFAVATRATALITVSDFSRECIERDLRIPAKKIEVVGNPLRLGWVREVAALRASRTPEPLALYVGRYAPNKNISRLIKVFPHTAFARNGGILKLIGGSPVERAAIRVELDGNGGGGSIQIAGVVSDAELDELYATARFLIAPSYEEGFGLPVREALAIGIPVCASSAGAQAEITEHAAATFDPRDDLGMLSAIDDAAENPVVPRPFTSATDVDIYGARVAAAVVAAIGHARARSSQRPGLRHVASGLRPR